MIIRPLQQNKSLTKHREDKAIPVTNKPRPKPSPRPYQGRRLPEKEALHAINEKITAPQVRLVGEEGAEVLPLKEALRRAQEQELDLVEISPKAEPPVVRIVDYQKFLYQQKKKAKEIKAKALKVVIKEIRFGPNTDDHDYDFKLKHAENFIKEGSKVKAYVFFRGREIVFKDKGEILLLRFATDLEEIAKVESMPKLEGKRMIMMLAPKVKK
jgi:translation initiation factor IF-3